MLMNYALLSRQERRAGKKLAKKLLQRTPPTKDFDVMKYALTPRAILSTAYMKSANVVGAFIYTDGVGHWWDDLAIKKGKGVYTIGRAERAPFSSEQEALDHLIRLIANIKAMSEHPLVETFRKMRYDPERVTLLRVSNQDRDHRFIVVQDDAVAAEASSFKQRWNLEIESAETADIAVNVARGMVLHYAKELDAGLFFLSEPADPERSDDEARLKEAAAFLVACGIINVSDEDPTDTIFSVIGEPDEDGMCPADLKLTPGLLKYMERVEEDDLEEGDMGEAPDPTIH